MYVRNLILTSFLVSSSSVMADQSCKTDSDCPSFQSKVHNNMQVNEICGVYDLCQIKIKGLTCGNCGDKSVHGKCCHQDVIPNAQDICECVDNSPCTSPSDCYVKNPNQGLDKYIQKFGVIAAVALTDPNNFDGYSVDDKFAQCNQGVCVGK